MNSALPDAVERPHRRDDRDADGSMRSRNRSTAPTSNTGRVTANSAPASTLYSKRRSSASRSSRRGFDHHADVKRRRRADRLAADVEAVIEPRQHVGQADGVHVEHRRRVGDVAEQPDIAGDAEHVAQPHRVRAEQVRLNAQQVLVAARVLKHRFDAGLLLNQHGERQRAHARAAARTVENRHDVDLAAGQRLAPRRSPPRTPARAAAAARRSRRSGRRASAAASRDFSRAAPAPARAAPRPPRRRAYRSARGARDRRRRPLDRALIWRMCSGVVPQQPPTRRTPLAMKRRAYDAMYSGEHEIDVAAFDVARLAGVRLRRQPRVGDAAPAARSSRASARGRRCS